MTIKQQLTIFMKGMAMGIVNVIPVSSGTVSLIIGVFERFINSIKSLNLKAFKLLFKGEFSEFAKKTDFRFLITLLLGILAGMILTAISLKAIFKKYEVVAYAFFIGLIVASVVYVFKMIGKKTPKMILLMIAAIVISFYLSIKSNPYPNENFLYLILCSSVFRQAPASWYPSISAPRTARHSRAPSAAASPQPPSAPLHSSWSQRPSFAPYSWR